MRSRRLLSVVLAGAAVLASSCAANDGHGPGGLATATPARTLSLEMGDLTFSTARLEARLKDVIDIEVRNRGDLDHDFTIERMPVDSIVRGQTRDQAPPGHAAHGSEYAVHGAPRPGTAVTVRLHPHAPGEYTYYCSVPGHREAGMTGTFVVS
jgi:uncharacterized cupredoxin-like copper-binding protein